MFQELIIKKKIERKKKHSIFFIGFKKLSSCNANKDFILAHNQSKPSRCEICTLFCFGKFLCKSFSAINQSKSKVFKKQVIVKYIN